MDIRSFWTARRAAGGTFVLGVWLFGALAGGCIDPENMPDPMGDGGVTREPPAPWVPPAEGAPECELAADCPEGTHCDLGECVQSCNIVDPCSGELTCLPRGRCAEDPDEPSDPPVSTEPVAAVTVAEPVIYAGADANMIAIRFNAAPMDREVRYRVDPRVHWLRVAEPRGTFSGSLEVIVEVDRSALEVGDHVGSVVLHTSAGTTSVPVHLTQSFTGVYQGQVAYDTPRTLGRLPLRLEVLDRGGVLDVRVVSEESPSFPRAGARQPSTSATVSGTTTTGSFVQTFTGAETGHFARPVGREVTFSLEPTQAGGLSGRFTERWVGIFPSAVEVQGSLSLTRIAGATPREFTVDLPSSLPGNPSANPPTVSDACWAITGCSASSSVSQLRACGQYVVGIVTRFRSSELVVPATGGSGYDSLSATCVADLDSAELSVPTTTSPSCVHPGALVCARTILARAMSLGGRESSVAFGETVASRADVATLVVNDHLVDAFSLPFRVEGPGVESQVLEQLSLAQERAQDSYAELFSPWVLDGLRAIPESLAASSDYRALRAVAQLLARDRLAADQEASLLIRTRPSARTVTREQIHADALELLLTSVSLAMVEEGQAAPPTPELGLFAEALTDLGRRSLQAGERIDPLGLPPTAIPFVYDAAAAGAGLSTNFQQVLNLYGNDVTQAASDETAARSASREFELSEEQLRRELTAISIENDRQLRDICGPLAGSPELPDIDGCGEGGLGALAEARSVVDEAAGGVQTALTRVDVLRSQIANELGRIASIQAIRVDQIEFITRTNDRVNAISWEVAGIEAAQTALSLAASGQLWNGFAAVALGAASAALELLQHERGLAQTRLQQALDLRIRETEANIEYLNGMAHVRSLMAEEATLQLQVIEAMIRATTAAIRADTLRSQVLSLQAEQQLRESRAVGGLANDPSFRVLRSLTIERAARSFQLAIERTYLAARAFEHETNTDLEAIESQLVPAIRATDVQRFWACLPSSYAGFRTAYGAPQVFVDEVSIREDILGIRGPITDEVTGEVLSEAEQFRRVLLNPSNLGPDGTVELTFATSLIRGNGLWSSAVCNDQLRSIQVRLVGDGLGDDQARVYLVQAGTTSMRGCESGRDGTGEVIRDYDLAPDTIEVQAGVNVYSSAPADTQFTGRSVAASEWRLAIPPASVAPTNADVDLLRIDDIVLRIEHTGISLSDGPLAYRPTCGG